MNHHLYRPLQRLVTLITLLVLMASFYFEFIRHLRPCPLCLMQRLMVLLLLGIGLLQCYSVTRRRATKLTWIQIAVALGGLYFALRQVWLQSVPAEKTLSCLPGLDVLIRYFPWQDVLHALMFGASDCAEVTWRWLGLTMPAWCALYFAGVLLAGLVNLHLIRLQGRDV